MKKYILYIIISLMTYLIIGFIKMQFNPQYWEQPTRGALIGLTAGSIIIYRIYKLME